jgi:uncharacterized membrane protein
MITPWTSRRMRLRLGLALTGVLAALGFGAYAVFAASGSPDFSITRTPATQTVNQGQTATYIVAIKRLNGFNGSVTLKASKLPGGASASWQRSDGAKSNVLPPGMDRARLAIKTGSSTPPGTSHPLITATSGSLSHTATVTLVVQASSQPNFNLTPSPWSRSVLQGDQTSYRVNVTRSAGFNRQVKLSVSGLPGGATASWNPSATVAASSSGTSLQIATIRSVPIGSYDLTITGTGTIAGKSISRATAATLVVKKTQDFRIAGSLTTSLAPGSREPLDLALTNPYGFNLRITDLGVSIAGTNKAGCSAAQNFAVTQIPAARYPITLPAGETRTLGQLGIPDPDKPQIEMLDQPFNQDACKNAATILRYSGSAGK